MLTVSSPVNQDCISGGGGVAGNLEVFAVVALEDGKKAAADGVIVEIRGDEADAEFSVGVTRVLVRADFGGKRFGVKLVPAAVL